jgi:hypothetical protein
LEQLHAGAAGGRAGTAVAVARAPPISHLGGPHYWLLGINQLHGLSDVPFPAKWVSWNVGYGLACLLLGLYLLWKVSLTKA